ncbi:MAG: DNA-directed RNA polymerase subunit omega [Bacteroidetes bacterium]|jgi:DNA-directed RNA polymerase subunit K/omega|nr:DNA-directed RNA polymerase subunit omega [Bacteroidota bacterium]
MELSSDNNIQSINILDLTPETGNIYKSVTIIAQRANQIGSKMKQELNAKLAEFGPAGDSLEEIVENREQIEIARQYEQLPKPTLLAVRDFLNGDVHFSDPLEA